MIILGDFLDKSIGAWLLSRDGQPNLSDLDVCRFAYG